MLEDIELTRTELQRLRQQIADMFKVPLEDISIAHVLNGVYEPECPLRLRNKKND